MSKNLKYYKEWPNAKNVKSAFYDPGSQQLQIEFANKRTYQYEPVSLEMWEQMIKAESGGKFFSQKIAGKGINFKEIFE